MIVSPIRQLFTLFLFSILLISACVPARVSSTPTQIPVGIATPAITPPDQTSFAIVDGSRPLTFPRDFGAHPDFRTEWWYYTGNLQSRDGQHFGFELTIFRVGVLSPIVELPKDSNWSSRDIYFAHFAISDIGSNHFYAFQRYSRPGLGLAGAQADPYHIWLEDWSITQSKVGVYQLQAEQGEISLNLTLNDEMGVVLQGANGYSRKGTNPTNASYYYSQPRLQADGTVTINGTQYQVSGLVWNDHEFSTSVLDENQIGWDWFSLQFEDGRALMLFQLRERSGGISVSASGTFITADKTSLALHKSDFNIVVLDQWHSHQTQGIYPSSWQIQIHQPECSLDVKPWMNDQEINFPPIVYWEGAVHFTGSCDGAPASGNGYIELTGYAGNLPLP
jgi:predicted secreted hydrolase